MKKIYIPSLAGILALVLLASMSSVAAASENPHLVTKNSRTVDCLGCHKTQPNAGAIDLLVTKNLAVDRTGFRLNGVEMCTTCHNPRESHMVGKEVDFPVPLDLPLGDHSDITCLTCHYMHGSLSSDRPQASVSFMDRLLNSDRLTKSFLLRRSVTDGELCMICHNF